MPRGHVSTKDQLEFSDADFRIVAKADQSKKLAFDLSRLTTATTRTQTVPDVSGVVALDEAGITTVASNTSTLIGASKTRDVTISGTTTITSFDTVAAGTYRQGNFSGILTFTHNATSLILPGGANITTAAGDTFGAESLGSGNWRVLWYQKASGAAVIVAASGGVTYIGNTVTTSGTSVSASGLVLTSYSFLIAVFRGIVSSGASTSRSISVNGTLFTGTASVSTLTLNGIQFTELLSGRSYSQNYTGGVSEAHTSSITTASTSFTVTTNVSAFSAGSFDLYGMK